MMIAPSPRSADLRDGRAALARLGEQMADIHLARFLTRPLDFVDPSHWGVLGLAAPVVAEMNRGGPFRRAVNGALAELAIGDARLDEAALTAMRSSREGRLCALLLVAPIEAVERVAGLIAAAVASRGVSSLLLSSDRKRVRAEMGDEPFEFAISEAPLMCADLVRLGAERAEAIPSPFADVSRALLVGLVAEIAPPLERLFRLRFPPIADGVEPLRLPQRPLDQAVRLILRKEPAWLASID